MKSRSDVVPRFAGRVRHGQVELDQPVKFQRFVEGHEGQEIELILRLPTLDRTSQQLRYWFGVPMKLLSEATGYTKMQMHYLALAICFGVVVDEKTGIDVPVVSASRHLTATQFSELIQWIIPWAEEQHHVSIPLPNEVDLTSLPGVET